MATWIPIIVAILSLAANLFQVLAKDKWVAAIRILIDAIQNAKPLLITKNDANLDFMQRGADAMRDAVKQTVQTNAISQGVEDAVIHPIVVELKKEAA